LEIGAPGGIEPQNRNTLENDVAAPSVQVKRQLLDDLKRGFGQTVVRQFPNSRLTAGDGLGRDAPARPSPLGKAASRLECGDIAL
jgi:hypothetical protein